jgi:hypothetical protein
VTIKTTAIIAAIETIATIEKLTIAIQEIVHLKKFLNLALLNRQTNE